MIALSTVAPRCNPGGLWVRVWDGQRVVADHALTRDDNVERYAASDALAALASKGSRTFIYDGDSGQCVMTLVGS